MSKPLFASLGCSTSSRAEARREKLIQVARDLFAQNGFHNTGIAQIARQSGVLVGQIYRDFESKEDIVAAIVARDLSTVLADDALHSAIDHRDADEVRRWIREFVAGPDVEDSSRLLAEIMAESSRNDRVASILHTCRDKIRSTLLAALEILIPDAAKADRRPLLADMIMTISTGLFHHRLAQITPIDPALILSLGTLIDREIDRVAAA